MSKDKIPDHILERVKMSSKLNQFYLQQAVGDRKSVVSEQTTVLNMVPSESTIPEVPQEFPTSEVDESEHPLERHEDFGPSPETDLSKYFRPETQTKDKFSLITKESYSPFTN